MTGAKLPCDVTLIFLRGRVKIRMENRLPKMRNKTGLIGYIIHPDNLCQNKQP